MLVTAAAGALGLATVDIAANVIGAKVCSLLKGLHCIFQGPKFMVYIDPLPV